jgi:putative FmdB family regulatory protein
MPTYEFRCPLGHEFERFYRSIGTAEAQTACPECGQMAERMMSAGAGLVFKGSGFYLTDYGKDAHKKKAPSETKGEGAKGEGAKNEGSKGEGSKGESSSTSSGDGAASSSASSGSDSAKKDAKPAESKPAPKPSSGE